MHAFLMVISIGFLVPSVLLMIISLYATVKGLIEVSAGKFSIVYTVFVVSLALLVYLLQ